MERKLEEANEPNPEVGFDASWHYRITHNDEQFTQHIFHYPEEGVYRTRIFHYPKRGPGGEYAEEELITFEDAAFQSPEEAIEFGDAVIGRWQAEGENLPIGDG